jgi:competence protein ComEC
MVMIEVNSRPLFFPLLGAILGLSLTTFYPVTVPLWGMATLLFLTFIAIFTPTRQLFTILLFLTTLSWGSSALQPVLSTEYTPRTLIWYAGDQERTLEGIIDERPESTGTGCRVVIRTERFLVDGRPVPVVGRLLLYVREGRTPWVTGDRVRCITKLRRPRNYGLPGEFDSVRFLALKDIFVTGNLRESPDLILVQGGAAFHLRHRIDTLARRLGDFISATVPGEEGGILRALLLGDRGYVPPATEAAYTRSGVNHILSISGFHVAVVALAVYQLFFLLGRCSEILMLRCNLRNWALLAGAPVVVFYLFLSGAAPATARSVIMILLGTAALWIKRETDPISILMVAACFLLGINPPLLFDLSFQLSFLALWGLIILTPLFMIPFKRWEQGNAGKILLLMAASVAAIAATLVPVAFYFHRTSVTGILANLVIVPLMGYGAVAVGFAALPILFIVPWLAKFLMDMAGFLVFLSDRIIFTLAKLPLLPHWSPTRADLLLSLLVLMVLTFLSGTRSRGTAVSILMLLMVGEHHTWRQSRSSELELYFLSLGQAESTLVRFPDGKSLLVDGGGSLREGGADTGERLLAPALWALGVEQLDVVALTHPHPDHLRGLTFIVENFPVGQFWESGRNEDTEDYRTLRAALLKRNVQIVRVSGSSPPLTVGEGRIEPLAPVSGRPEEGDVNDDSLVFRLIWRDLSMLFTGDIGAGTEALLLKEPQRLMADILKVGHHGSRYSSTEPFLQAVAPRMALISAGYGNSFHLPATQTLERLAARKIPFYRTDLDGTITLRSSGHGFTVTTMKP